MTEFDVQAPSDGALSTPDQPTVDGAWLLNCVQALQVDGASLLLNTGGHWRGIASTGETAARITSVQLVTGQGPGVQAIRTGRPVQIPDWPHDAHRWPLFAAGLGTATVGALYALPLQSDDHDSPNGGAITLGVLHVHRAAPGILDARVVNAVWLAAETVAMTLALT